MPTLLVLLSLWDSFSAEARRSKLNDFFQMASACPPLSLSLLSPLSLCLSPSPSVKGIG